MSATGNLRLAELIATLSLATDLGLGMEQEHSLRQCRIAHALGEASGASEEELRATYYVGLLAWVGCISDQHNLSVGFEAAIKEALSAHSAVASTTARRLGLGPEISDPLNHMFERWNGRGHPDGLAGEEIPLPVRLVQVADIVEVHEHRGGLEVAQQVVRERAGNQLDPNLAELFDRNADEIFAQLESRSSWKAVIELEPSPWMFLTGPELESGLEALADCVDLKSPWFTGHSRQVASLADEAARVAGLPEEEIEDIRHAALVHDIGRVGVPTSIWNRSEPLSPEELEKIRLSPYLTERVLAHSGTLSRIGRLAASHQERLDGSGYPRGIDGSTLPPAARILAVADSYAAMREERPQRPALSRKEAAEELRMEVSAGRLDATAVESLLETRGQL